MTSAEIEAALTTRGWAAIDLPDPSPVEQARDRLLGWLRSEALPDLASLDDYHLAVVDDDTHVALLRGLAQMFWDENLAHPIITAQADLFRQIMGPDLHVQRRPYLRAVRPSQVADASPMHRDTYYGASPYEVSVVIPFTEMEASAALRVLTGSHVEGDAAYPFLQTVSPDVVIRSPKHELGFPYAPRLLEPAIREAAEPVPLKVGQALMFGLSLIHGGGENRSVRTRFSTDVRLVNSLAPASFSRGVDAEYFVPFSASPISRTAEKYLALNTAADAK